MKRTTEISKRLSQLEDIKNFFEDLQNSKQDSYDNKSEKWQESDKGDEALEEISNLEDIVTDLSNAFDNSESLFEMD